jgi:hypothetical protein
MAEDDPASDEDETRAIIALRSMDEERRRYMVALLERIAKENVQSKAQKFQLVSKTNRKPKK